MRRHLLVAAALLALLSPAKAADSTVSALSAASAFGGTELMYIVQSSADTKGTPAQMATYVYGLMSGDCTVTASAITCTKVNGVTFPSSFTSGGIPYASASGAISSSAALTANLPVIGGGAGAAPSVGTRSGNTTAFVTTTGTQTSGDCVKIDANGNHIANGSACGGGGSGVAPSYYVTGGAQWYPLNTGMISGTGAAMAVNTIYCAFGSVNASVTIKSLGMRVVTGQAVSNAQFAIYSFASTPTNTLTLVDSTASIATATNGANVSQAVANTTDTLSAGTLYAICVNTSVAGIVGVSYSTTSTGAAALIGSSTQISVSTQTNIIGKSIAQTFGTWPGTLSFSGMADVTSGVLPQIVFLVN